jgi:hypothetical protein
MECFALFRARRVHGYHSRIGDLSLLIRIDDGVDAHNLELSTEAGTSITFSFGFDCLA